MDPMEIKRLIEAGLEGARVEVDGDGRHFNALVVSDAFAGKNRLARHRLVYGTLGDHFQTERLHALSLSTLTTEEWSARQGR